LVVVVAAELALTVYGGVAREKSDDNADVDVVHRRRDHPKGRVIGTSEFCVHPAFEC
jgi:hypothetical protein